MEIEKIYTQVALETCEFELARRLFAGRPVFAREIAMERDEMFENGSAAMAPEVRICMHSA